MRSRDRCMDGERAGDGAGRWPDDPVLWAISVPSQKLQVPAAAAGEAEYRASSGALTCAPPPHFPLEPAPPGKPDSPSRRRTACPEPGQKKTPTRSADGGPDLKTEEKPLACRSKPRLEALGLQRTENRGKRSRRVDLRDLSKRSRGSASTRNSRKEVIQPQVPLRLPCYDFAPVTKLAFGRSLPRVGSRTSGTPSFHGVTGGVYKARERIHRDVADSRLLAIPPSCSRVADYNPNLDRLFGIRSPSRGCSPLYRPL